jgi:hypothetical protein
MFDAIIKILFGTNHGASKQHREQQRDFHAFSDRLNWQAFEAAD